VPAEAQAAASRHVAPDAGSSGAFLFDVAPRYSYNAQTMHTVKDTAAALGICRQRVQQLCQQYSLGVKITSRMRLLSARDVDRLRRLSKKSFENSRN